MLIFLEDALILKKQSIGRTLLLSTEFYSDSVDDACGQQSAVYHFMKMHSLHLLYWTTYQRRSATGSTDLVCNSPEKPLWILTVCEEYFSVAS